MKKIISLILSIVIFTSIMPNCAFASEQEVLAQYSGSTTASWGYNPDCTFTINKIVGNKFRGSFSAQNIGKYSFSENVSGFVTRGNDCFTCYFRVYFYNNLYYSNIIATVYPYEGKCECFSSGTWQNEIKSVYFVPPYFCDESNHSSNIFDFEKGNSKWKIKYNLNC